MGESMDNQALGKRVRQLRKARGLKQQVVADQGGLANASVISKIENGQMDVPFSTLVALAKGLDVPLPVLCGEDPPDTLLVSAREIEDLYTTAQSLTERLATMRVP